MIFIATTVRYKLALKLNYYLQYTIPMRKAPFLINLNIILFDLCLNKKKIKIKKIAKTSHKITFSCSVNSQQWFRYVSFNLLSSVGFSVFDL